MPLLLASLLILPIAFQDDEEEERPDNDPRVAELVAELGKAFKEKLDAPSIPLVDELTVLGRDHGPKDQAAIRKIFAKGLKAKRRKIDNVPQHALHTACALGLGELGPESFPLLEKGFRNKLFAKKDGLDVRCMIARAAGRTKSKDAPEWLADLLDYKDPEVVAAAAEGMRAFADAEIKVRREMVGPLVKQLEYTVNRSNEEPAGEAQRRAAATVGPMVRTLQDLTGQRIGNDVLAWRAWWNKNRKKKDWTGSDD